MPVILVRSLRPPDSAAVDRVVARVAVDVARAIASPPDDVWVYWQEVGRVAIGGGPRAYQGHCPVVTILTRGGRTDETVAAGLRAAAEAVSAALSLPLEDVWVHWVDCPPGRIFAGGAVR